MEVSKDDYGSGAIQSETNRRLRQKNRNLEGKGPGLGPRTVVLADKGTRVLITEVAEDLRKKAEAGFKAELEAKLRLEISERKGFL